MGLSIRKKRTKEESPKGYRQRGGWNQKEGYMKEAIDCRVEGLVDLRDLRFSESEGRDRDIKE